MKLQIDLVVYHIILIRRLGSRSQGYHPVAPWPIDAGHLCFTIYFRPSSPEALHVMRPERPLLVKDGITGEKWPVNLACDSDFRVNHWVLLHVANLRHGTVGFTSARKACCGFFRPKNPGSNPRSWVPEASMLTTRPPKPI
jgi:hypothetical protein